VSDVSLLSSASFVLAVTATMDLDVLRQRFPSQAKLGSVENIRQLVNVQLPGIKLRPLPVAPRQVPYHTGYVYFELDKSGDLWKDLGSSGGLAMHIGGEFPELKMELWAVRY
jgi:type VI secretion system protein ImpJ